MNYTKAGYSFLMQPAGWIKKSQMFCNNTSDVDSFSPAETLGLIYLGWTHVFKNASNLQTASNSQNMWMWPAFNGVSSHMCRMTAGRLWKGVLWVFGTGSGANSGENLKLNTPDCKPQLYICEPSLSRPPFTLARFEMSNRSLIPAGHCLNRCTNFLHYFWLFRLCNFK